MFHGKTVISPYWFRRTEARSSSSLFHLFRIHNTSVREQTDLFVALRIGILIFFTRFNCRKEGFLTCSGPFRDVWKFISFEEISKCDASHVFPTIIIQFYHLLFIVVRVFLWNPNNRTNERNRIFEICYIFSAFSLPFCKFRIKKVYRYCI